MDIQGLDEDVGDVLALLNNLVQVNIIAAGDTQAFAGIGHDLFIVDHAQDLDNLLQEVIGLNSSEDAAVLSQATGETADQILYEELRFLLDGVAIKELCNEGNGRERKCFIEVLVVDEQWLEDTEENGELLVNFLVPRLLLVLLKEDHDCLDDVRGVFGEDVGVLESRIVGVIELFEGLNAFLDGVG